jgi:hypothetical protein
MDEGTELLSATEARPLLASAGYSDAEIETLTSSGIFAFDRAALAPETRHRVMRSEPIDIFGPTMNLAAYEPLGEGVKSDSILLDTFTGSAFTPVRLAPAALLGRSGFGPEIPALGIEPFDDCRVRFNSVSYFLAEDAAALEELCTKLQAVDPRRIYFRGQPREYLIKRDPAVLRLLYGGEAREPSIPSAAFRHGFPYVDAEATVQMIFSDIIYRLTGKEQRRDWVEDWVDTENVFADANGAIAASATSQTMALAQHYGIPTYGLDVTRSFRIAWWFATWQYDGTGALARYTPYTTEATEPFQRPVVYVFRSTHGVDLADLDLVARRPTVQEGLFLHGSWGPHGNLCAEDLIATIVLGPGVGVAPLSLTEVFPGEAQDAVYAELLAMKRAWTDEPFASLLKHVYELDLSGAR